MTRASVVITVLDFSLNYITNWMGLFVFHVKDINMRYFHKSIINTDACFGVGCFAVVKLIYGKMLVAQLVRLVVFASAVLKF